MTESFNTPPHLFDSDFLHQLERLAILSRQVLAGNMKGDRRSPKRGQSVEYSDFRPYTLGDDIRRIDWNAYARLEKFFLKLFVEEEDITVHLLLDTSASMNWGKPNKLDYAIQAAAALGYIALVGLDRITLTILSENKSKLRPSPMYRGKKQAYQFFSFLQNISSTPKINLLDNMKMYQTISKNPGPLLLFSDLYDPQWREALGILSQGNFEISILHILSPDEISPDFTGDLKLLDSESDTSVEITADFDLIQKYKEGLSAWKEEIKKFCANRKIHYIPLETSLPLQKLLFSQLQSQGVLK